MGNKKTKEIPRVNYLENKILSYSGLEISTNLFIYNVHYEFQKENNYIHTIHCGKENGEVIVLIHGFACSSVVFYKMINELSMQYQVYCIDIPGMGLSSRSNFKCETTDETIEYFVGSIEEWRKKLDLKYFTLFGHSLGAYIACQYAHRYKNIVKKLFLGSPMGVTLENSEYDYSEKNDGFTKLSCKGRFIKSNVNTIFSRKQGLSKLVNIYCCLICLLGNYIARRRFKHCPTQVAHELHNFC